MARNNMIVIRDFASLQAWVRQLRTIIRPRRLPIVLFQLHEVSDEQNRSISALAESYRRACGCASSGFFMSITVVSIAVSYFVSGNHLSGINLQHVLSLVGITVLAALSGKLMGLIWARWRMLRLAARMRNTIARDKQPTVNFMGG